MEIIEASLTEINIETEDLLYQRMKIKPLFFLQPL